MVLGDEHLASVQLVPIPNTAQRKGAQQWNRLNSTVRSRLPR